ncbi:GspE/PulE family protein [Sulfoacidibacillus thermotolerans]|uniref:Type II secretion system protein GspE n=1 Tax=Sulfoacidibacillus thermotolerans TaxID=1765684 RepID=A0A2U3DCJ6_SULT2|nr:GspE/PulE family protein [Sulfoacidibacillus thermotolerans]PWI59010.1 type II secretion system protein GspE [Sulfoacidibacillus thermotolerans]
MAVARKRLGDLLYESGLISKEQLEEALRRQKGTKDRLGDVLIQCGFITEKQLIEVLEFQLGIPHVTLAREKLDPAILALVPDALALKYVVLPLRKERNKLLVAMADPLDYYAIDDLRMSTGFQIEAAIAAKDELRLYVERVYGMKGSLEQAQQSAQVDIAATADAELLDEDSPVVRLVNQLLSQAVNRRASDIHLDPMKDGLFVRMRIDGMMRQEQILPKQMQQLVTSRVKVMANMNIAEHRLPQDGRFRIQLSGRDVDVRVSILPTLHGEKIVMRVLDLTSGLQRVQDLGFSPAHFAAYQRMLSAANGLVLITGPTGSGKTSTLYAGLVERSTPEVNVITIEDPVEYQLTGVNQVAVNVTTGLTFARGLRAILRQDPDVVMVGEIRDTETAEIAVRAALTGHLVLSTLHTNDALSTVARLVDMGIDPFLVASSLTGVIAQRLVRRVCEECKGLREPSAFERELLARYEMNAESFVYGKGCSACGKTGYKGRLAIHEVLEVDEMLRGMIARGAHSEEIQMHAKELGFHTLLEDGLEKAAQGLTTIAEVVRVALR